MRRELAPSGNDEVPLPEKIAAIILKGQGRSSEVDSLVKKGRLPRPSMIHS